MVKFVAVASSACERFATAAPPFLHRLEGIADHCTQEVSFCPCNVYTDIMLDFMRLRRDVGLSMRKARSGRV